MSMIEIKKIEYRGWPNCYRMRNGIIELIVTADVGPRIIYFGLVGQHNEFAEFAEMLGQTGGDTFQLYGGHRFWHAPEHPTRTYYPDNAPVEVTIEEGRLCLLAPMETHSFLQKEIEIEMSTTTAEVSITHRLINHGQWGIEVAPWALSVMAPEGLGIAPQPPHGSHSGNLLPATQIVLWAYTDMSDPRWTWGRDFIFLRQDPDNQVPQKVGMANQLGWLAYANRGHLFVKHFGWQDGAVYPDCGSSAELFTDHQFLELESLGVLSVLAPGGTVEHGERWQLFDGVADILTEEDARAEVWSRVRGS